MDGNKSKWQSKAVWGNLVGGLVSLFVALGVIDAEQGTLINLELPTLLAGGAGIAANAWGFYGRVVAKDKLT